MHSKMKIANMAIMQFLPTFRQSSRFLKTAIRPTGSGPPSLLGPQGDSYFQASPPLNLLFSRQNLDLTPPRSKLSTFSISLFLDFMTILTKNRSVANYGNMHIECHIQKEHPRELPIVI